MVWAVPLSLAATSGIANLLSIPPGTEMFHFPGCAPSLRKVTAVGSGVSPFGDFRI